jgi:hypothetical protein
MSREMAIIEKHVVPGHLVFAVAGQAPHEIDESSSSAFT